ncbi:MAG: acyl-CoA dehydrogenase, partial [Desulfobacterales bacterium]|nr:acyl-CoA dehydrogenase [Desulfobacterales bacterium]
EAMRFAKNAVAPLSEVGEEKGVAYEKGQVTCPSEFREVFRQCGADGWTAAARDTDYGGQGFPHMMRIVINDFMYGACQSFNMAPSLTHGAAHLIESFGAEALKQAFVPRMYDGTFSGTMCLTEPEAGSNLAATQTTAYPDGDHYRIKGNKIFISWGDHDIADNIVHLILARTEGAPEGVRGISLFVVPKYRLDENGRPGEFNDVVCTGIEEKLGLHASPTAALAFGSKDDCVGYLCGEPNRGLAHMFQMMNSARINTGVSGMTLGSNAYQHALEYTRQRIQGADVAKRKEGYVPIIDHPDVRRMLLWMKASVDGMRSMIYTAAFWAELAEEGTAEETRQHYQALTDFMTPIVKAYCSDTGFRVCEIAMQCLGGYGYCRDYPIEQFLRDAKIMSLYEGTNGIQAIDLMGRKMRINDGAMFNAFCREIASFFEQNRDHEGLGKYVRDLENAYARVREMAEEMRGRNESDRLQWGSYSYPALLCFAEIVMVWRLLDMARIAYERAGKKGRKNDFFRGKVAQATFYADLTLPHTIERSKTCMREGREIVEIPDAAF